MSADEPPHSEESDLNVLLVTYQFPSGPSESQAPVLGQRWASLCRESAKLGFAWHVITPSLTEQPDSWEFAPWVRVHHPLLPKGTFNPNAGSSLPRSRWQGLMNTLRGLDASRLPDATAAWIEPASRLARQLHQERHFSLVVSHGLPVSAHVIARQVARQAQVAWVADWESPWADNPQLERKPVVQAVDRKLEADLVRDASGIVTANRALLEHFRGMRHEIFEDGMICVPYGFDLPEIALPTTPRTTRERLRLVCTDLLGGQNTAYRHPAHLLEALGLRPDLTAQLEIVFVGLDETFRATCEALSLGYGVSDSVQFLGCVSAAEMRALLLTADVCLTFGHLSPLQAHDRIAEAAAQGRPVLHVRGGREDASLEQLEHLERFWISDNHRFALAEALEVALAGEWLTASSPVLPDQWNWASMAGKLTRFLEGRVAAHRATVSVSPAASRTLA